MQGLFDTIFAGNSGVGEQLLDLLGITCTVSLPPVTAYDPATGTETEQPAQTVDLKCSPPDAYNVNEIDGTNILAGDAKIIISGASIEGAGISHTDLERGTVTVNGEDWNIVTVNPIVSGSNTAVYELQLRK